MKKIILTLAFIATGICATAQVGIGNTNPQTTLDVTGANNGAAVAAGDGVLVPRVTNLTAANIAAADGALVFLTADSGADLRGFYYWSEADTDWLPVGGAAAPAAPSFRTTTTNVISDADLGNYVVYEGASSVSFNLNTLTKSLGAKITFMDASPGNLNFTGDIKPNMRPVQIGAGGSMVYVCDGTFWYLLTH